MHNIKLNKKLKKVALTSIALPILISTAFAQNATEEKTEATQTTQTATVTATSQVQPQQNLRPPRGDRGGRGRPDGNMQMAGGVGNMPMMGMVGSNMQGRPNILANSNKSQAEILKSKDNNDLQGPFFIVDESPYAVIKILEDLTGKVAVQTYNLPNVKINFQSESKLPRNDAITAITSLLTSNGVTISPIGEKFFKASPIGLMNTQAVPILEGSAKDVAPTQEIYSKLYTLKYLDVDVFFRNLYKILPPESARSLATYSQQNAFLVSDTLVNHLRIEKLIEQLDKPFEINQDMEIIMLKNMTANDMKRRFYMIKYGSLRKYLATTTIEADERTNQIIVSTPKGNMPNIKNLIEKLDIKYDSITKSEVYYIKHGIAEDIASVLNTVIKGQISAVNNTNSARTSAAAANNRSSNNRMSNNRTQNSRTGNAQNPTDEENFDNFAEQQIPEMPEIMPESQPAELSDTALQFSDYITIVSDERSNSIVAYGTANDLKQIGHIIEKIDVVLPQVKIDVIITEVSLTDSQSSGLSSFGLDFTKIYDSTTGKGGWSGSTSMMPMNDSTITPFSLSIGEKGFSAIFGVASENSNVKILSAPTITTTHNKEATLNISETQPLITQTTTYDTSVYPSTQNSVEWEDIGIILNVTPLIGDNGIIQMELKQTVDTVVSYQSINDIQQPIIGKRQAESFITAKTGEVIILAGMQQTTTNDKDGEVFLLSDIPLIGNLFSPANDTTERKELIIFIRPTVIYNGATSDKLTRDEINNSPTSNEVNRYLETGKFHNPDKNTMGVENRKYSSFVRTVLHPSDARPSYSEFEKKKSTEEIVKEVEALEKAQQEASTETSKKE